MAAVFVSGFELRTDEAALRDHFGSVGDIIDLYFQSRSSSVITYASPMAAAVAVEELNQSTMRGQSRWVAVKLNTRTVGFKGKGGKADKGKGGKRGKGPSNARGPAGGPERNARLIRAVCDCEMAQIMSLLEQRTCLDFIDDEDNMTPLMHASINGHVQVVQLLLNAGADINLCDDVGEDPLYVAAKGGHAAVAQLLCDMGADIFNAPQGWTPICIAHRAGHPEVVQCLLDARADINDLDAV